MGDGWVFALVMLQWMSQASTHPYIDLLKGSLRNDTEDIETGIDAVNELVEGVESVPYTIIDSNDYYEKRLYPPMTMACSEMVYNITEEDGGEETDGKVSSMMIMYRRMTTQLLKKKPSRLMFMKLFRYISGLNKGVEEIPMTSPVLSLVMPLAKSRIHKQMCFYLGKRFNTMQPPKPRNAEVEIITKEKFEVYVHTFGGYSLKDAHWVLESEKFKLRLNEEKVEDLKEIDFSKFLTAGYDSPMKFWNRRNEILFTIRGETDASQDVIYNNTESGQDAFKDENSLNVTNEEEIVETKSDSAPNSFNEKQVESKEIESQSSDSSLDQYHALNITEHEIGEVNPHDAFKEHINQVKDNENSTYNGNVMPKLSLFQGEYIDQSEPVINETDGSDELSDLGIDDGHNENEVENQTEAANVESQRNKDSLS